LSENIQKAIVLAADCTSYSIQKLNTIITLPFDCGTHISVVKFCYISHKTV